MPDYSKSKIYKIVCDETQTTYYGSTLQPLTARLSQHKRPDNKCMTKNMINPKIYLVEDFVCERKEQLHQRERYFIENNECINICIPTRTKEEISEYKKKWEQENKDKICEQRKQYRQDNKEIISERKKHHYNNNKEKYCEYRKNNKEKMKEYNKEYHRTNKIKLNEDKKERQKNFEIYECECGSKFKINSKNRHERSVKHIKFIESKKLIV